MLRKLIVFFSILLLLFNNLLILTLLSGCSLIGYGIGSTLDSPSYTVSNVKYQMREIEIGRNVTVYLRNGREKTGREKGAEASGEEGRKARERKGLQSLGRAEVPAPCGEIHEHGGAGEQARFHGQQEINEEPDKGCGGEGVQCEGPLRERGDNEEGCQEGLHKAGPGKHGL